MTGEKKRIDRMKASPVSNHKLWALGMICLMSILAAIIILAGDKSIFLISFFFLMVTLIALYFPWKLLIMQIAIASLLTFIILYKHTHLLTLVQWAMYTFVYLFIGIAVNREISAIRQIQRHEVEMSALSSISASLTKTLDLCELTNQVVDQIFSLFQADGCTIYLMDEGKNHYGLAVLVKVRTTQRFSPLFLITILE
ncbi:hypothetical protein [Desulfosporosinus sp. SB140]|uniref:hypothetical protein n=1 Tax=Desulfosporosinus paludis TaxID=3115649 RepID=UPI00388FD4DF